jgi:hypothetical protein
VKFWTLFRLMDEELDILERHITSELSSGIYSCGIDPIEDIRA